MGALGAVLCFRRESMFTLWRSLFSCVCVPSNISPPPLSSCRSARTRWTMTCRPIGFFPIPSIFRCRAKSTANRAMTGRRRVRTFSIPPASKPPPNVSIRIPSTRHSNTASPMTSRSRAKSDTNPPSRRISIPSAARARIARLKVGTIRHSGSSIACWISVPIR